MPWTARRSPDNSGLATVVFSGLVSGADLRDATVAAAELGKTHGVTRYLVDATAVVRQPREAEFFVLPSRMYDQLGFDRRAVRVAVVSPPTDEIVRFYETACVNRGWQVQVFEAFEPAIAWLEVSPAGAG
jgi:hypothetical protein